MRISKGLLRVGLVGIAALGIGCGLVDDLTGPDELGVNRFSASSEDVSLNEVVTLSWEVTGADSVSIDQGIGNVEQNGSRQVRMSRSARFTLTAESESSQVTATVDVVVDGASVNPVSTPVPEATPEATPVPDATPTPEPTGVFCGDVAASPVFGCAILVTEHAAPATGQCFEVTRVNLSESCPMNVGQKRNIEIDVTALTSNSTIKWRYRGSDTLQPFQGALEGSGFATIEVGQTVQDSSVTVDFYDANDTPLKSVTIQNN